MIILQQPQTVSPAFNDLIVLVQSTNYASADFKFIAQVKDGSGNLIKELKVPVLNGTDKGVFKIERIIDSFTSYDFDIENDFAPFTADQGSMKKYKVELGEEYLGTEYLNLTSITDWAFPGAMDMRDFASYASGEWCVASGETGVKFLTNQRSKIIRQDQWDWLYFLEKPTPLGYYINLVRYKSYNDSGLLKTVDIQYADGSTGVIYMSKIPSGRNTSEIDPLNIVAGTTPVIHPAATYYTVALYDNSNNLITEEYQINLNDDCSRYDSFNLCYQNQMGGFDSFMFNAASHVTYEPAKKMMKRQTYELSGSTYSRNLNKHGLVAFDSRETKKIKLNSDWLEDAESAAMHELLISPYVFVVSETDYIPVSVSLQSWQQKDANTDGLFQIEIEISFEQERRQSA